MGHRRRHHLDDETIGPGYPMALNDARKSSNQRAEPNTVLLWRTDTNDGHDRIAQPLWSHRDSIPCDDAGILHAADPIGHRGCRQPDATPEVAERDARILLEGGEDAPANLVQQALELRSHRRQPF